MRFKEMVFILILIFAYSCSSYDSGRRAIPNNPTKAELSGNFVLRQQLAPPADIQSVQLHLTGQPAAPPIIKLNSSNSLTLEFDYIGTHAREFKISLSHREQNWEESPLAPHDYINGFYESYINGGGKSFTQNPPYFHYSHQVPNKRIGITKSGNYLLSISDYNSGKLLFRIPFFVLENRGTLQTRIESLFAQRNDGRTLAQPFSVYAYPQFVTQPQFNLSFSYVQNRFWGRARSTDFFDTATPGEVHFHLGRDQAYIKNYEFDRLDLHSFQPDGRQIIDLLPGKTPPRVILRRDVQQFEPNAPQRSVSGLPRDDRHAEYGDIRFSLVTNKAINPADQIYLVGDFNNWIVDEQYRMRYDSTANIWKGEALVKQGIYSYKYVQIKNQSINDLALDRSFTKGRQEYLTFVYYRDPDQHYDRLLQVKHTIN